MTRAGFEVMPFPRERHDVVDALEVGVRRHIGSGGTVRQAPSRAHRKRWGAAGHLRADL